MSRYAVVLYFLLSASGFAQNRPDDAIFQSYRRWASPVAQAKAFLSERELEKLYRATLENPVSKLDQSSHYDPTGEIGFCFGRAMTAHLGAVQMHLSPKRMGKLFIVGALCAGCTTPTDPPEWRFHVTTVVQGPNHIWYAIDPIMHEAGQPMTPLTVEQWIAAVRSGWDRYHGEAPKAKLYFTPVETVMPDITTFASPETGARVIELNFDPTQHGIAAPAVLKTRLGLPDNSTETIYQLNRSKADEFFLTLFERQETRFNLLEIAINGDVMPFNNYFVDLMASDLVPAEGGRLVPQALATRRTSESMGRHWLGGFAPQLLQRSAAGRPARGARP